MSLKIEGLDELNATLAKLPIEFEREAAKLVNSTANGVRNNAVRMIQRPSVGGVTYEKYSPRRTHTASAAGEPPNTDTGRLIGSIRVQQAGKVTAEVIAGVDYARYLEFGTRHMAARPFMTPAVEQERSKFERGLRELTRRATK